MESEPLIRTIARQAEHLSAIVRNCLDVMRSYHKREDCENISGCLCCETERTACMVLREYTGIEQA